MEDFVDKGEIVMFGRKKQKSPNLTDFQAVLNKQNELIEKLQTNLQQLQNENKQLRSQAIEENPGKSFWLSDSVMTPNESLFNYYIGKAIKDEKLKELQLYLFPQVSLHSFVKLEKGVALNLAKSKILSKSVDFLICKDDPNYNYQRKDGRNVTFHRYRPALAIEIDGDSHLHAHYTDDVTKEQADSSFQHQIKNDHFKDKLFEAIGLPLLRYQLPSSNIVCRDDGEKIRQLIEIKLLGSAT